MGYQDPCEKHWGVGVATTALEVGGVGGELRTSTSLQPDLKTKNLNKTCSSTCRHLLPFSSVTHTEY